MRNTGFFKVGILFCWYGSLILNGVFLIDFFTAYLFKTQIISSQLKFCWCRLRLSWWHEDETTQITCVAQGFFLPNALFFFYKNIFYKNIKAEIRKILRIF